MGGRETRKRSSLLLSPDGFAPLSANLLRRRFSLSEPVKAADEILAQVDTILRNKEKIPAYTVVAANRIHQEGPEPYRQTFHKPIHHDFYKEWNTTVAVLGADPILLSPGAICLQLARSGPFPVPANLPPRTAGFRRLDAVYG